MPAHSPPSPQMHPAKRLRQSSPDRGSPSSINTATANPSPTASEQQLPDGVSIAGGNKQDGGVGGAGGGGSAKVGQSSNFRNVSACNRCRLRKNRCDQKLPSCASCEKANVACVGYDPITKKEIPRSYVFYLETRVEQLESLLRANNVPFPTADSLEHCSRMGADAVSVRSPTEPGAPAPSETMESITAVGSSSERNDEARLQRLVSKSDITHGKEGTANPRYLGSTSGVSFARVVFAAVQSSVNENKSTSDKAGVRPYKPIAGNSNSATGATMRDSFFGLHTKPTIHPSPFPDKEVGLALVNLYFEHANPQIPILHKVEFMKMFEQAYDPTNPQRGPKELYMLNMVFAIGGGIIMGAMAKTETQNSQAKPGEGRMSSRQAQPEEYHASAIVHLEACLNNSGGGLEELQAVLLLANFALLRPVPPGLWYIVGVAVRLAVDLGLHYEDGKDVDSGLKDLSGLPNEHQLRERGRREFIRDLRRRLWWSTYSFDRLVSICVGRPFGISDQVITTEFPSLLEDMHITPEGFLEPPPDVAAQPTYKLVAHHYFRLRLLQSEILQVLQYQQAQAARTSGQNVKNPYMHTSLPSPFLSKYESFRTWRIDIDKRLYEWKESAPTKQNTGVGFSTEFLDLNYWQAVVMLYRQSLSVPAMFEGEYNTSMEVHSPSMHSTELREDEDRIYLKVAEAGQKIMRLYRQLHVAGVINYTYLATHHIFMAGISYLYAIWHSPIVRSRLSMDEVDFTILAATSVFTDLSDKCPPAEACREAIDRTAKATIRMANSTGGFGQVLPSKRAGSRGSADHRDWASRSDTASVKGHRHHQRHSGEQHGLPGPQQFGLPGISDAYANVSSGSQLPPIQSAQAPYRMSSLPNLKAEPDGFSMMRNIPGQPRSNISAPNGTGSPDTSAIDPSLLPSPSAVRTPPAGPGTVSPSSKVRGNGVQPLPPGTSAAQMAAFLAHSQGQQGPAATAFSPGGHINFSDLQGMDFLNQVGGNANGNAHSAAEEAAANGDFGFGLGWEGLHHDFSDGQQYDLFDGFFFGGQQGGAGSNGVL
ncbi:Positive regulator of purine utilization [Cytospora mali]|uniref:Positive regulator of purine utilization n=1 Tax=Cytospora mali TaxID=578113 RepID=A0A194VA28_CYTMA|nr:Positive regulator of purine utilization [Valsa mali var. pyri (nom. inval.)]